MTQIGTAGLGGGMVNGVTSQSQVQYAAGEYNRIGNLVKRAGLQLFLHNEGFENSKLDDGRLTYPVLLVDARSRSREDAVPDVVDADDRRPDHVLHELPGPLHLRARPRRQLRRSHAAGARHGAAGQAGTW